MSADASPTFVPQIPMTPTHQAHDLNARGAASDLYEKSAAAQAGQFKRAEKAAYGVYKVAGGKSMMVLHNAQEKKRKPVHEAATFTDALTWVIKNSPAYHPRARGGKFSPGEILKMPPLRRVKL